MKSSPTSFTPRWGCVAALALSTVAIGCRSNHVAMAPTVAEEPPSPAERLAAEGRTREAFVAYLDQCVGSSGWDPAAAWSDGDARRRACAAAFDLRGAAAIAELVAWRDVAAEACGGATTPAAIAVCRGVAELSLAGPLEDHRRARQALVRGCHAHGDYAACLRLQVLGDPVRTASATPTTL